MLLYLRHRGTCLKRLCLLVDARHGFKKIDRLFLELLFEQREQLLQPPVGVSLDAAVALPKVQVVLTKGDLVAREDLARRISFVRDELRDLLPRSAGFLPLMPISSTESRGVLELQRELASLLPGPLEVPGGRAQ